VPVQPVSHGRGLRITADTRRARDLIRAELHRGPHPGGRLPGEHQLMAELHVSRRAVRGALALLREAGAIDRLHGVGTVVLEQTETSAIAETSGVGPAPPGTLFAGRLRARVLDDGGLTLPPGVARRLAVPAGSPGRRIDYVALLDEQPLWVATNYLREPEADALDAVTFSTDYYAYLADAGVEIARTTLLLEASVADEYDAELLDVVPGAALMWGEQVLHGPDGAPFNVALVRARGDRVALLSRAHRPA